MLILYIRLLYICIESTSISHLYHFSSWWISVIHSFHCLSRNVLTVKNEFWFSQPSCHESAFLALHQKIMNSFPPNKFFSSSEFTHHVNILTVVCAKVLSTCLWLTLHHKQLWQGKIKCISLQWKLRIRFTSIWKCYYTPYIYIQLRKRIATSFKPGVSGRPGSRLVPQYNTKQQS